MADLKGSVNPLFLQEAELRAGLHQMQKAIRVLERSAQETMARHDLGAAHGRALAAIARNPGASVTSLLLELGVTKQSLGRVLDSLEERGLVTVREGDRDRRQRLLSLTEEGRGVEHDLFERSRAVLARAYRTAGADSVESFRMVLSLIAGGAEAANRETNR